MLTANPVKRSKRKVCRFEFPEVQGMEDIQEELCIMEAASPFMAMFQVVPLDQIQNDAEAQKAERMIEYLDRAFENEFPDREIKTYLDLLMLIFEKYDSENYVRAFGEMTPQEVLSALLKEDGLHQKDLVPEFFKSPSQVSEFLHSKKGRDKLSFEQAVFLGKRFHVDPECFLLKEIL
jgi:antitoxin component HigA of HigAB toxin-antitoxin module